MRDRRDARGKTRPVGRIPMTFKYGIALAVGAVVAVLAVFAFPPP